MVPATCPNSIKSPGVGVILNSALNDFAAQAYGESVRGLKNIGKRKLRASDGPKTFENVSSNGPCPAHPMGLTGNPGTCSGHPGAIPETSQALQKFSWDSKPFPEQVTSQQSQSSSDQPAATSHRKQASDVPGSKKGVRRQVAEGP